MHHGFKDRADQTTSTLVVNGPRMERLGYASVLQNFKVDHVFELQALVNVTTIRAHGLGREFA